MTSVTFSLKEYLGLLDSGRWNPPAVFSPYYDTDPRRFRAFETSYGGRLETAWQEIEKRTPAKHFGLMWKVQAKSIEYSARAFPSYRFILPEVLKSDWLATVDWGKFQRDHVLHQPLSGYVALQLLGDANGAGGLELPDGDSLLDACVNVILEWRETEYIRDFLLESGIRSDSLLLNKQNPAAIRLWRNLFRETAYLAAIFHDLGYPWQYATRGNAGIKGLGSDGLCGTASPDSVIEEFSGRLLFKALSGYVDCETLRPSSWKRDLREIVSKALMMTHGFPGAMAFLYLHDCVRRFPVPANNIFGMLCVEWAAMAIMMHDMGKIYWGEDGKPGVDIPTCPFLRLGFQRDPLSALITLVDVIQDFRRPFATFQAGYTSAGRPGANRRNIRLNYQYGCKATEVSVDKRMLRIVYRIKGDGQLALKKRALVKERLEFFDPKYGYLDMATLGFERVEMDARLV